MSTDSGIRGVHHINLLVRDLDDAMQRYRDQLGVDAFIEDSLPGRGVRTARFRAGDTWVVLVQPTGPGEPQRVLDAQGEGLFLLSLSVDSLPTAMDRVRTGGGELTAEQPRTGLDGWQVIDIQAEGLCGGQIQLTDANG